MEIENMSNKELFREWETYNQIINDIGCYGIRDLMYLTNLNNEIDKRNMVIKKVYKLKE
jgi:hypothetical protein